MNQYLRKQVPVVLDYSKSSYMAHILVPVDFSVNAKQAYIYALQLAGKLAYNVKLLHVYSQTSVPDQPLIFEGPGNLTDAYKQRLQAFSRSAPNQPDYLSFDRPAGVEVSYEAVIDLSVVSTICQKAETEEAEMIVMGTSNKQGFLANWLGSTAASVSERANCPVLLIPPQTEYRNFERIVVANDYSTAQPKIMDYLINWAELFQAALHFVHIVRPKDNAHHDHIKRAVAEQLVTRNPAPTFTFAVINVPGESIAKGLREYAEAYGADLMVIVNHQRARWRALLRMSLTKNLALHAKRPLLIMHREPHS